MDFVAADPNNSGAKAFRFVPLRLRRLWHDLCLIDGNLKYQQEYLATSTKP